jgi:hypothetical protein
MICAQCPSIFKNLFLSGLSVTYAVNSIIMPKISGS